MRHASRTDSNQREIIAALRAVGAQVYYIKLPVDLLVRYRGVNYLLEVKTGQGRRTKAQERLWQAWRYAVVCSPLGALQAIGAEIAI